MQLGIVGSDGIARAQPDAVHGRGGPGSGAGGFRRHGSDHGQPGRVEHLAIGLRQEAARRHRPHVPRRAGIFGAVQLVDDTRRSGPRILLDLEFRRHAAHESWGYFGWGRG